MIVSRESQLSNRLYPPQKLAGPNLGCAVYNDVNVSVTVSLPLLLWYTKMIRRRQRLSVILYGIDVFSDREAHFGDIVPETDCRRK